MVQVAGILLGASEGRLDEPRSKAEASFCIAAGADDRLIPLVFTPSLLQRGEGLAECAYRLIEALLLLWAFTATDCWACGRTPHCGRHR